MKKLKTYFGLLLSVSLILSSTGFAELCNCFHEESIKSIDVGCCETNAMTVNELTSCCSSNEQTEKNKKCDDLHNSCSVCNSETIQSIDYKYAILVNNLSSSFKVPLKDVQFILTLDNITD